MSSPSPSAALELPLQSDPPWLQGAVLAVSGVSILAFAAVFSRAHYPATLGTLPGVAMGVFAGSALAAWARRRGATVTLRANPYRLEVIDPRDHHGVLELAVPFSAMLLVDAATKRRLLVLGQDDDPIVVMEPSPSSHAADAWAPRVLSLDLSHLALTPASPKVVALAEGHTLDALLEHVGSRLDAEAPLLSQSTPGGRLQLRRGEVRFGTRAVTLDGTVKAIPYSLSANGMNVAALGLVQGEGALMLFACEDAFVEKGAVTSNLTPDAYLPLATWEILRSVVAERGSRRSAHTTTSIQTR